jgi:hypothetical protein
MTADFFLNCGDPAAAGPLLKRELIRALHTVARDSRILQPTRLPLQAQSRGGMESFSWRAQHAGHEARMK